ncbi:hypothetical protein BDY19DRAFT_940185 [Irpex rosettiformis]|uniref:Uncharacterized protein n=1 Tax=Irpex rosettiformis TaxID=378272 RepID=A0ACB8U7T6_9APHY|nr:hypothetical protein BDY19DRAFT_940185 [Irpex rosettiformis]
MFNTSCRRLGCMHTNFKGYHDEWVKERLTPITEKSHLRHRRWPHSPTSKQFSIHASRFTPVPMISYTGAFHVTPEVHGDNPRDHARANRMPGKSPSRLISVRYKVESQRLLKSSPLDYKHGIGKYSTPLPLDSDIGSALDCSFSRVKGELLIHTAVLRTKSACCFLLILLSLPLRT